MSMSTSLRSILDATASRIAPHGRGGMMAVRVSQFSRQASRRARARRPMGLHRLVNFSVLGQRGMPDARRAKIGEMAVGQGKSPVDPCGHQQ